MSISTNLPQQPDRGGPAQPLLSVCGLTKSFARPSLFLRKAGSFKALNGVSFEVKKGRTLGIVGESGCGKSTCARLVAGIMAADSGEIFLDGEPFWEPNARISRESRRAIQMVFQESASSLNPRMTVGETVAFGARVHGMPQRQANELAAELLDGVGLPPTQFRNRHPAQISGGQRQRVNIARAIAVAPRLLILDEPVSALDKSVEAQVLHLLVDLRRKMALTYIFISHDLNVVRFIADDVAVMYLGEIVEKGPVESVFANPSHPYTRALLASRLPLDPAESPDAAPLKGEPAGPGTSRKGCVFRSRCELARDICAEQAPTLVGIDEDRRHHAACWMSDVSVLNRDRSVT